MPGGRVVLVPCFLSLDVTEEMHIHSASSPQSSIRHPPSCVAVCAIIEPSRFPCLASKNEGKIVFQEAPRSKLTEATSGNSED